MELLYKIVINIVLIIFFTSVFEMFLPSKDKYGKYISMVMGLLIIATVLNPIINLVDHKEQLLDFSTLDKKNVKNFIDESLQNEIEEKNKKTAESMALNKIENQIASIATLVDGIKNADVKVTLGNTKDYNNYLDKIQIIAYKKNSTVKVAPVNVQLNNNNYKNSGTEEELKEKIITTVANFYGVDKGKIEIKIN